MNASSRVNELMLVPIKDAPAPAIAYAKHLGKKYGMCGEVYVTAYAHYAECFEGAEKSDDSLYAANDEARAFFAGYRAATENPIPEGWQLVPIEPTIAMQEAGEEKINPGYCEESSWNRPIENDESTTIYKAMLAAAPKPEEMK